jgi:hypothetical protein
MKQMKKTLLAVALLAVFNASATERGNPLQGSSAEAYAVSGSKSTADSASNATGGSATGGNSGVNVDTEKPAASSAIAPSVGTNNNCLVATPASKAASILLFSVSGTTGFHYSGLCLAFRMENYELAEKLMCLEDKNYAKLNPKCEVK